MEAKATGAGERVDEGCMAELLLIDTAGADGSLALASAGEPARVLRSATMPGRSASERLFAELRSLLAGEGRGMAEWRAIAVVRGPGSFTGARIGVAAAKGLAEALHRPLIGLSRLVVLAAAARDRVPALRGCEVVALLRAGRGEVFAGRFREGEDAPLWERLLTSEEVLRLGDDAVLVAAEGEVIDGIEEGSLTRAGVIDAAAALRPALRRLRAGMSDEVASLGAHYLRRTPAEVALQRREAEASARHE